MHKVERNYVHQSFVATHKPGKCAVSAWSMRGFRNCCQGGPGQSDIKALTTFFSLFFVFLVLSLFYWSQIVNFEETYHFSRFQRGSNIFQRGPTFSRGGGSNFLFPIETHITCGFPVGSGPPVPPLDPHFR